MSEPGTDLRERLLADLRRHPRVVHQQLFATEADRRRLADALPKFVPFKESYARALWILDWDHRLPSRGLVLRLYTYYTTAAFEEGERAYEQRALQIKAEELFPEFDVPDFAGLRSDESYEAELEVAGLPTKFRLVSEWRRQVEADVGRKAEAVARASDEFKQLIARLPSRPLGLGDLEAAEWSPPSESSHERWALEVWYLKSYNGMIGEGIAFLVDTTVGKVVGQREFQFRAG